VYAIAAAGQRALGFLLLPLYTTVLSPAEYGRISLLVAISAAAYVVLAAGFDFAVIRQYFHHEGDPEAQQRFVSSAWIYQMWMAPGLGLLVALPVVLFAPSSDVFRPTEVAVAILAAAVLVVATIVPLSVLRCEQRLKPYLLLSFVAAVSTAGFTIAFVVMFRRGVVGWLEAMLCANTVSLVVAMCAIRWSPRQARDREGVKRALALGLPLVPHALAQWSLQVADRVLLSALVVPAALGVYSLGANLALPALILIQSLNQGFMPTYARFQHDPGATSELRGTITMQIALVAWIGAALALVGPPVVAIVSPPSYGGAEAVIPWITLGYVFLGFYFVPMNGLSLILGRTKFVWVVTACAAAINLAAIWVLVGPYGIVGAAAASAIGYLVQFVAISVYAKRVGVSLSLDWQALLRVCAVAAATYVVGATLLPADGWEGFVLRTLLALASIVVLAVAAGVPVRRLRMSPRTAMRTLRPSR
jgi:O-antigen/teichoic acid export membrane protein